MTDTSSERVHHLDDSQIDFYLAEYQRVLDMFELYTSVEARNLRARLTRFIKVLRQEAERRKHSVAA